MVEERPPIASYCPIPNHSYYSLQVLSPNFQKQIIDTI